MATDPETIVFKSHTGSSNALAAAAMLGLAATLPATGSRSQFAASPRAWGEKRKSTLPKAKRDERRERNKRVRSSRRKNR